MKESAQSLSHTKWNCKYHIVFAPKYRRQEIYGKLKYDIGKILRQLCDQKNVEIIEAELCPDHIHHVGEHSPESECSAVCRIFEREECPDDIRQTCKSEI